MSVRPVDPKRLDVEAFARAEGELAGAWPLRALSRLCDYAHPEVPLDEAAAVAWQLGGVARKTRSGEPEIWLRLAAQARLPLVCQRCLGPLPTDLAFDRAIRFVRGEDAAAELDAEVEEDVLALTRALDVQVLIEDELLLALPLVPRHDSCPDPLPFVEAAEGAVPPESAEPGAFDVLSRLKRDA